MSKHDVELGDKLVIEAINVTGVVTGILLDRGGLQYRLLHWYDNRRREDWFMPSELQADEYELMFGLANLKPKRLSCPMPATTPCSPPNNPSSPIS